MDFCSGIWGVLFGNSAKWYSVRAQICRAVNPQLEEVQQTKHEMQSPALLTPALCSCNGFAANQGREMGKGNEENEAASFNCDLKLVFRFGVCAQVSFEPPETREIWVPAGKLGDFAK